MIITVSLVKHPLPHFGVFFPPLPPTPAIPTTHPQSYPPTPPLPLSMCPLYMFLDGPSPSTPPPLSPPQAGRFKHMSLERHKYSICSIYEHIWLTYMIMFRETNSGGRTGIGCGCVQRRILLMHFALMLLQKHICPLCNLKTHWR